MHDTTTTALPFAEPPPDPELKRLEPLVGAWTTEEHTRDSVLGPGVPVRSHETFHWLDGGYFLVHDLRRRTGFYDSEAGKFRIIFFSNNGPFSEEGNRYEGHVAE